MKRCADVIASAAALVALTPLLLVIAGLVRLDSAGPTLFVQTRIGRDRKPFRMLKFRTMRHRDPRSIDQFAEPLLSASDPRVTRVGRLLRAASLDELPQLWNVLRGDMSLVGPRPVLPEQLLAIGPMHDVRFVVRPGITGLAQVAGRQQLDWPGKLDADVEYARNASLWLDLRILGRTVAAVSARESVYYDDESKNWRRYVRRPAEAGSGVDAEQGEACRS